MIDQGTLLRERVGNFLQALDISKIPLSVVLKKAQAGGATIRNSTVMRWKQDAVPRESSLATLENAFRAIAKGRLERTQKAISLLPPEPPQTEKD